MEKIIRLKLEKLPEGLYLGTSEDIQGLVAQGRTVSETINIAHDVAKKLLEAQLEREGRVEVPTVRDEMELEMVVGL
jgi:predicted RNase H-like HicB family nuclease